MDFLQIKVERTFCITATCNDFQGIAYVNKVSPCNTINDPSDWTVGVDPWSQQQLGCRVTGGGNDRGTTMILFQNELESALDKLKAVQDQIFKLVDEKEETKRSEMQSRQTMEDVVAQLMGMEKYIINKEQELECALLELDQKMKTVVGEANQSLSLLNKAKQVRNHYPFFLSRIHVAWMLDCCQLLKIFIIDFSFLVWFQHPNE